MIGAVLTGTLAYRSLNHPAIFVGLAILSATLSVATLWAASQTAPTLARHLHMVAAVATMALMGFAVYLRASIA